MKKNIKNVKKRLTLEDLTPVERNFINGMTELFFIEFKKHQRQLHVDKCEFCLQRLKMK